MNLLYDIYTVLLGWKLESSKLQITSAPNFCANLNKPSIYFFFSTTPIKLAFKSFVFFLLCYLTSKKMRLLRGPGNYGEIRTIQSPATGCFLQLSRCAKNYFVLSVPHFYDQTDQNFISSWFLSFKEQKDAYFHAAAINLLVSEETKLKRDIIGCCDILDSLLVGWKLTVLFFFLKSNQIYFSKMQDKYATTTLRMAEHRQENMAKPEGLKHTKSLALIIVEINYVIAVWPWNLLANNKHCLCTKCTIIYSHKNRRQE